MSGRPEIIASESLTAEQHSQDWQIEHPEIGGDGRSAYLRLRLDSVNAEGVIQVAYTNPVRILAAPSP